MGDSMAERMEAGWQAARHWETECEAARAERDGHLETIRETFRVLESRGQAPDDNAPLSVTVRRVLDALDRVTTERDALKKRVADAERLEKRKISAMERVATALMPRSVVPCSKCRFCVNVTNQTIGVHDICVRRAPGEDGWPRASSNGLGCAEGVRRGRSLEP